MKNRLIAVGLLIGIAVALIYPSLIIQAAGQNKDSRLNCDRERALLLVQQQLDQSKKFDETTSRISILMRVADLLWRYEEQTARAVYTSAYKLAEDEFQQSGQPAFNEGSSKMRVQDQRFRVIHAIAKHDPEWARKLAESEVEAARAEIEHTTEQSENGSQTALNSSPNLPAQSVMGSKIMSLALSMLDTNQQTAIKLVRTNLKILPVIELPSFLYKLAENNQHAADELYLEAINLQADSPLDGLFYLMVYPFALNVPVGPVPGIIFYEHPRNFAVNAGIQQIFLEILLSRAKASLAAPSSIPINNTELPEIARIYIAMDKLKPVIAQYQPSFVERISSLESSLGSALSSEVLLQTRDYSQEMEENQDSNNYVERLESLEREADPAKRNSGLARGILNASGNESLDTLERFAKKISDTKLREQILNWIYFKHSQITRKQGRLDDASRIAEKVDQLDLRAYLHYEIAVEALKKLKDKIQARETLDTILLVAQKAPDTNEKARTLLGIAHLYSAFDAIRAFEVMSEAVKTINKVPEPNLTGRISQKIKVQGFGYYARYEIAGFSLENAFRNLGPHDFDGALYLARSLEHKILQSMAILALSSLCLEKLESPEKNPIEIPRADGKQTKEHPKLKNEY